MEIVNKFVEDLKTQVGIKIEKIILFSAKYGLDGHVTSFKLCVVADVENKFYAEKEIYMTLDCDIPFDVIVYTKSEWESLYMQEGTFANRLTQIGRVLYG